MLTQDIRIHRAARGPFRTVFLGIYEFDFAVVKTLLEVLDVCFCHICLSDFDFSIILILFTFRFFFFFPDAPERR